MSHGLVRGMIVPAGGAAGGSLTVEEQDGAPTGLAAILQFAQADGFAVTFPVPGTALVNLTGSGGGLSSVDLEFLAWVL